MTAQDKFLGQNKDQLLHLYNEMLMIRRLEEKAGQLYGMGKIAGFCHLYIGQEAVVIGVQSQLDQDKDTVITAYRDHGHMMACGMDAGGVLAELMGREGGFSKGKGGSMHMFSTEKRFYGGHGIVGAQIPIGTGIGFAHKYEEDGGLCVAYMGDGAANQGQVYESFNMASLWKLPVLYIIENNQYAMGTSTERHSSSDKFYLRGEPFGIKGEAVNGMDVFEVQKAAARATQHIREGKGPYLLEIDTYRYKGHSMSDPAKYRDKEEVDAYRKDNDPIINLKRELLNSDMISEDEFKQIEDRIKEEIKKAVDFAEGSPEPDASELYTDVLVESE